jgi:gas vesicle protein
MKNAFSLFIVGAGIGCCAALLLAPERGKRVRARLRDKTLQAVACVQQSATEIREETEDLIDEAFDLARRGSEAIETQRSGIRAALDAGIRAYNKTVHA